MKKLMSVLALVGLMVLTLSCSAFAAGQASFDYVVSGDFEDADFGGYNLGLDYKTDSFKFGVSYLMGDIEDGAADNNTLILKAGYGITENVYISLAMFNDTLEFDGAEEKTSGILLGAEVSYDFSDQLTFEGALGISVSADTEYSEPGWPTISTSDVDLTVIQLKLIYNVSDAIGVTFGYNNISTKIVGESSDLSYMTLGAAYKF